MVSYASQRNRVPSLRRIGFWATCWWAVSGAYVVLLVWASRNASSLSDGDVSIGDWTSAIGEAFTDTSFLQISLAAILLVWFIGGLVWLRELKRHKISYKTALKDLFFTIRK